jgi:hypothetical protein
VNQAVTIKIRKIGLYRCLNQGFWLLKNPNISGSGNPVCNHYKTQTLLVTLPDAETAPNPENNEQTVEQLIPLKQHWQ